MVTFSPSVPSRRSPFSWVDAVARAARPVGAGGDDDPALRVDEEALPEDAYVYAMNVNDPGWLADLIAQTLPLQMAERQAILETIDPNDRLQKLSTILARELDVLELEDRIQANAQSEVDRSQREYYLRERMRATRAG